MFDNMHVKHKPSNLGHKVLITCNGTLREIDITLKFDISFISEVNLVMSVCATVCIF